MKDQYTINIVTFRISIDIFFEETVCILKALFCYES